MRSLILAVTLGSCLACSSKPAPASDSGAQPEAGAQASAAAPAQPSAAAPAQPSAQPSPALDITPSGETRAENAEGLLMLVPSEWTRAPVHGSMRKAEFVLPGPGGEASLVVYRFEGGAGTVASNIERWRAQIELAPGSEAVVAELEGKGLTITSLDARGSFPGQAMPGMPPQPPIVDARLLAAAIEGSGDPYYFKIIGPAATLELWAPAWTSLLATLAPAG